VANGFKIVSSGLFIANVSVYTSISGCSCQVLTFFEWNMLSIRVLVALSQTKVDDVDTVLSGFSTSDEEVIGLDISMNDSLFMNNFYSLNLPHPYH
jgi:hypothetical protein